MKKTETKALLLSGVEAAELLGISRRALLQLKDAGALLPVKLDGLGHTRYRRSDVEEFVASGRAAP